MSLPLSVQKHQLCKHGLFAPLGQTIFYLIPYSQFLSAVATSLSLLCPKFPAQQPMQPPCHFMASIYVSKEPTCMYIYYNRQNHLAPYHVRGSVSQSDIDMTSFHHLSISKTWSSQPHVGQIAACGVWAIYVLDRYGCGREPSPIFFFGSLDSSEAGSREGASFTCKKVRVDPQKGNFSLRCCVVCVWGVYRDRTLHVWKHLRT